MDYCYNNTNFLYKITQFQFFYAMKYTIVFVTNNYTPYSGGVVSSINATAKQLQKLGHTVYIIAPSFFASHQDDPKYVIRIPSLVRFRYKQNHMAVPWLAQHYVTKFLEQIKPDVVHVHHPFLLGPIAVRWAKKRSVKTVFTYHTMYEAYVHYVPLPAWLIQPIVCKRVVRFCKSVDQIIVPSYGIQKYLADHTITNTAVIPMGLQERFSVHSFLQNALEKPYQLLYVGRFTKEKNISFLLDVVATLPDCFQFTLVGYGAYIDNLRQYAYQTLNISVDRVRFIIKPDKQTLVDLYRNAHFFLFSSCTDTQGLVLAESMACSTPVIALDGVGQRDIICEGQNGFLVADQEDMRNKIMAAVGDVELYTKLQRAAWQTAQRYHPEEIVKAVVALYERNW